MVDEIFNNLMDKDFMTNLSNKTRDRPPNVKSPRVNPIPTSIKSPRGGAGPPRGSPAGKK